METDSPMNRVDLTLEWALGGAWHGEDVFQTLQQRSIQYAWPVWRTYQDVFAAAASSPAVLGFSRERLAQAGIGVLADMNIDDGRWWAVEARLDRGVSQALRELLLAAAQQLQSYVSMAAVAGLSEGGGASVAWEAQAA